MKDKKDCFIILRVTKTLKEKIEKIADNNGNSLSEFVRNLLDAINEKKS